MQWPQYGWAWLTAQGRICAVYGEHIILNRYSTWNRNKTTFLSRHYFHNSSTWDIGMFGYIDVHCPKERSPGAQEFLLHTVYTTVKLLVFSELLQA